MDCRTAKRLIPAFMDGELEPHRAALLDQHLASCHSCRLEAATLKRTMEAMGVSEDIEPSFTLADIRERAGQHRSRNPLSAWLWQMPRLATAAMLLAALAVGGVSGIYHGSRSDSQPQRPHAVSTQRVSDSFGLDAFDDGLAGALYVADARTQPTTEVTR